MKINVNNPFRIHGVVSGHYFTNRADEVDLMVKALTDPGSKLLVYGPRRMGKTSAVLEAISPYCSSAKRTAGYIRRTKRADNPGNPFKILAGFKRHGYEYSKRPR